MKTNFFENITALNVPGNWKLAIHNDEKGGFTVSALFTLRRNSVVSFIIISNPPSWLIFCINYYLILGYFMGK